MAAILWALIVVVLFVASSVSLSCDRLCNGPRCILKGPMANNTVNDCCNNSINGSFTMKFNGSLNISESEGSADSSGSEPEQYLEELTLENLTLKGCAKPIIIEGIRNVKIINVDFR